MQWQGKHRGHERENSQLKCDTTITNGNDIRADVASRLGASAAANRASRLKFLIRSHLLSQSCRYNIATMSEHLAVQRSPHESSSFLACLLPEAAKPFITLKTTLNSSVIAISPKMPLKKEPGMNMGTPKPTPKPPKGEKPKGEKPNGL